MKISLAEWQAIETAVQAVKAAESELQDKLMSLSFDQAAIGNQAESIFLIELGNKISELFAAKELIPYFYHPQEEWTGGDSSNPANFKHREPHIVGSFPKRVE